MSSISSQPVFVNEPIPAQAGIGLKFQHINEIVETNPPIAWVEVHAENFMSDGGPSIEALARIRRNTPVSIHGVGLSIGGAEPLDKDHLNRLKHLVERVEPGLVSEHLAWCTSDGRFLNDLLPVPYDEKSLATVVDHVNQTQDLLSRTILIENPSLYVGYKCSNIAEPDFLNELAKRTGCGLLLDLNNIFVSGSNLSFDPTTYLKNIDLKLVREIHLAGHHTRLLGDQSILIDDHGSPVCAKVWDLYKLALCDTIAIPTLIEWDNNIPALAVLLGEAQRAQQIMSNLEQRGGQHATAA